MNQLSTDLIVNSIADRLISEYVDLQLAKRCVRHLQNQLSEGVYYNIKVIELATLLTTDLQAISFDKHLRVRPKATNEFHQQITIETARKVNYGFSKLEILEGNIGYMDIQLFYPTAWAAETAAAAMRFVSDTEALVIDLRKNLGGDPEMVSFLCTYFFTERTHLNDIYNRADDSTEQFWTLPYVPGPLYVDKPLFILTSSHTFSGAEEFAYDLKALNRARIIGEITKGGANLGSWDELSDEIEIFIPMAQPINPISKENWEGKGVVPHNEVNSDNALSVALSELKALLKKM